LKEVDSDVEERRRANGHAYRRNRFRRRRGIPKSAQSEEGSEGPKLSVIDGEDIQNTRPAHTFRHHPPARKQTSSAPKDGYGKEVNKDEV
jgi:hypothetical protein